MSTSIHHLETTASDGHLPAAARPSWQSLVRGLVVYCSTVSLVLAAASTLIQGLPADALLASL